MKYTETEVVFSEFPDEITLAINISNCPIHCPGCSSKWLWNDIGNELNISSIQELIKKNEGITCIGLMGGDRDHKSVNKIAKYIKSNYPELKVGWYSGLDSISENIDPNNFDYIKLGAYDIEKGPLNMKTTNQRMYQIVPFCDTVWPQLKNAGAIDITYKFWEKKI